MKSILQAIGFVLLVSLVVSCGSQGSPSGGPRDKTPPKIVKSSPLNYSSNFNGREIKLKFDEYVKLNSIASEFIISPPVKKKPKFTLKGKTLTIKFDSAFAQNTTYSLFFGKGIADFNENNPLDSNLFVFSTGEEIDSLELKGEIYDGLTYKPDEKIFVFLYKNHTDSVPSKELPSYFAVAKEGHFKFTNIAKGQYKIFALKDENQNYKYDLPNEKIAFRSELVTVDDSSETKIKLHSFVPAPEKLKVKSKILVHGQLLIELNKPDSTLKTKWLNPEAGATKSIFNWNKTKDTLLVWNPSFIGKDSLLIEISSNSDYKDTVTLKSFKEKTVNDLKLAFASNFSSNAGNIFTENLELTFNKPITVGSKSFLISANEGDTVNITGVLDEANKRIIFPAPFNPETDYELFIPDSAIKDFTGEILKPSSFKFSTVKQNTLGNLNLALNIEINSPSYVLEILKNEKVIKKINVGSKESLSLKGLKPGEYRMRLIVDLDSSKNWTPGNYYNSTYPEEVIYYKEKIRLRANWDLDIDWNIIP